MYKVWPVETVGLVWLKEIGTLLLLPAVALTTPQADMLEEQIVIAAEPLVVLVLSVKIEPLMFV